MEKREGKEYVKGADTVWDVAVIGGGPAGMMAAGRAGERGLKVLLIEKNQSLGKKLLITGGGRCNVTNAELDTRKLLQKFKGSDKYLFSAFSKWNVKDTLNFFHTRGMETKVERELRVFPVTEKASSVWNVLVHYMRKNGVRVMTSSPAVGFRKEGTTLAAVRLQDGREIKARSFILGTGGKSRPETGSTGDGFQWLRDLGHTVFEPDPALVPLKTKDLWVKRLQGITLPEVTIRVFQNGVKQDTKKGKILFTHFGISGPTVLNMSKDIGELLKYGEVTLALDMLPTLDYGKLNEKLQEILKKESNKKFKNALTSLLPAAVAPVIVEHSGIHENTFCHSVTREERLRLVQILKAMPIEVTGLLGVEKAVVTSGGVSLQEVDSKTMCSRLIPNLYLIGDILHIDRPSGGYSLQLCWTSGFVAGDSVEGQQ